MRVAAAKATAEAPQAKVKRKRPDFNGVPGKLVELPAGLEFSEKVPRQSPYDPLLKQLADAGRGQVLCFEDPRARNSVKIRSKKLGLRVSFAENGNKLYVRLDGKVEDDVREMRRTSIRAALKIAPHTDSELMLRLRAEGDTTIDMGTMQVLLVQMQRDGDVLKQEGGKWTRNPRAKA